MKKTIFIIMIIVFNINVFGENIRIYAPKAPPGIPFIKAKEINEDIDVILYTDINSEVLPKILKKEDALYVVPSNVAAKLYNKKMDILMLGITSMGLLYVLSCDEEIKEIKDLNGKEVYIGDKGSSPDIVSSYVFDKKGSKPEFVYSTSFEIARFMIAGKIQNCVLPEPLASIIIHQIETKGKYIKRIASMKEEWKNINKTNGVPQTSIITSLKYYNKNKKEIDNIINDYKNSIKWVNENNKAASVIGKKIMESDVPEIVIERSIPNMNLVFINGKEGKEALNIYFNILNKYDGVTVGGEIPDAKFYGE